MALLDLTNATANLWGQEFTAATAPLVRTRPYHDGGCDTHALLLSRRKNGAELYDVAWESETMGAGLWWSLRHIYVLHDADGQWRFVGEGPSELHGHVNNHGHSSELESTVRWTNDAAAPVRILYSFYECDNESSESSNEETVLTTHREAILEGSLPVHIRWLNSPHHIVEAGETFESVVRSIAGWRGSLQTGDANASRALLIARRLVLAKNPFLLHRIAIPGTFVSLPDYNEFTLAEAEQRRD
jgi:hypothetical protein